MQVRYTAFIALLLIFTISMIPSHAFASDCTISEKYTTLPQIMLLSSNVFVGTVTSVNDMGNNEWNIHFNIEDLWKGIIGQQSMIVMANDLQGCGYQITTGQKYLVYTAGDPPFLKISWTKTYVNAQNDIALLNNSTFQEQEKTREALNRNLESIKDKISSMMLSKTSDIPFSSISVDEINSTLNVGIDNTKSSLSKDAYQEKIKEIFGDIPLKIDFGQIIAYPKNVTSNLTVGSDTNSSFVMSPLKQFKSGISAKDVKCNNGFHNIIKAEDGSPACVKPDTSKILVERGWAKAL